MKKIKKFINKNKEFISYCFFGGLTTILNLLLFWVLNIFFKYYVANIITLIVIKTLTLVHFTQVEVDSSYSMVES